MKNLFVLLICLGGLSLYAQSMDQNSDIEMSDSLSLEAPQEVDALNHDPDVVKGAPVFPEPMIFDLVRPLGARKGEFEANTLALLPLQGRRYNVDWAPEIEYAFANGYAIELELPMYNGEIEAYKLALQGTFSFNKEATFIHGWQWIGEYILDGRILENSFLYLMGYDIGGGRSIYNIVGPRHNLFDASAEILNISAWTLLYNFTFNQKINQRTILAIENNYAYHVGVGHEFRVTPQVHWRVSEFFNFQIGGGYQWMLQKHSPIIATRLIRDF